MFKVEARPGYFCLRNGDITIKVSGAANHASMVNLAEQYLMEDDLAVFRDVVEVFGGVDGFTVEYDDSPPQGLQKVRIPEERK